MFNVVSKRELTENVYAIEIRQPAVAAAARPGHYVDVHVNPDATPVTLPVVATNQDAGTITIVNGTQDVAGERMMMLREGDEVFKVKGPLGGECAIDAHNKVVLAGEGLGVASLLPRARAFKADGAYTICILGFPTRDDVYWNDAFNEIADELYVTTTDGSFGVSGRITEPLGAVVEAHKDIERIVVIAELKTMRRVAKIAANNEIAVRVSFDALRGPIGAASLFEVPDDSQEAFTFARAAELAADDVDFDKLIARARTLEDSGDAPSPQP